MSRIVGLQLSTADFVVDATTDATTTASASVVTAGGLAAAKSIRSGGIIYGDNVASWISGSFSTGVAGQTGNDRVVVGWYNTQGATIASNTAGGGWSTLHIGRTGSAGSALQLHGSSAVICDATGGFSVDSINEQTADAGVTVDGVLLKDSNVVSSRIKVGDPRVNDVVGTVADIHIQKSGSTLDNATARLLIEADAGNDNTAEQGISEIVLSTDANNAQYRISLPNNNSGAGTTNRLRFGSHVTSVVASAAGYDFFAGGEVTGAGTGNLGTTTAGTNIFQINTTGVKVLSTTASSTTGNGALTVAGGAGIAGALNVGGALNVTGAIYGESSISTRDATVRSGYVLSTNYIQPTGGSTVEMRQNYNFVTATASVSTGTGALVVAGGVGIAENLYVGGNVYTDQISPEAGANVLFTSSTLHNGTISVNQISERDAAAGVTVDGVLLKDNNIVGDQIKIGSTRADNTIGAVADLHIQSTVSGTSTLWLETDATNSDAPEKGTAQIILSADANSHQYEIKFDNTTSNELQFRGVNYVGSGTMGFYIGDTVGLTPGAGTRGTITRAGTKQLGITGTGITVDTISEITSTNGVQFTAGSHVVINDTTAATTYSPLTGALRVAGGMSVAGASHVNTVSATSITTWPTTDATSASSAPLKSNGGIAAAKKIWAGTGVITDLVDEATTDAGVTVDGVLLKDGGIVASGTVTAATPTLDAHLATKLYVDNLVGGGGYVVGPVSATDNAIARFDSTTGKLIQNSSVTVSDAGNVVSGGYVQAVPGEVSDSGLTNCNRFSSGRVVTGNARCAAFGPSTGESDHIIITADTGLTSLGCQKYNASGAFVSNQPLQVWQHSSFKVLNTTASTTTTEGALTVAGGVGVAGRVVADSVATNTILERTAGLGCTVDGVVLRDGTVTAAATGTTYKSRFSSYSSTSGVAPQYIAVQGGKDTSDGWVSIITLTNRTFLSALNTDGSAFMPLSIYSGSALYVESTTASISSGTGALTVAGGVGIAGAVFVGGNVSAATPTLDTHLATKLYVDNLVGGAGSGDVVGPVSATDNAIARFDSTTGKLIQNSLATINDAGMLQSTTVQTTGTTVAADQTRFSSYSSSAGSYPQNMAFQAGRATSDTFVSVITDANRTYLAGLNAAVSYTPLSISPNSPLQVESTAASSTTASGALIVKGGAGIAGSTFIGGDLTVIGADITKGSIGSLNVQGIILNDDPGSIYESDKAIFMSGGFCSVKSDGILSLRGAGGINIEAANGNATEVISGTSTTGGVNAGLLTLAGGTGATTTSSGGAVLIKGGYTSAPSGYDAGNVSIVGGQRGGVTGYGGDVIISGGHGPDGQSGSVIIRSLLTTTTWNDNITATLGQTQLTGGGGTDATSTTNGGVYVASGLSVAKQVYGRNFTMRDDTTSANYNRIFKGAGAGGWLGLSVGNSTGNHVVMGNLTAAGGAMIGAHNNALNAWASLYINDNASGANTYLKGIDVGCLSTAGFRISSTTASTTTTSGALRVTGGAGIGGNISALGIGFGDVPSLYMSAYAKGAYNPTVTAGSNYEWYSNGAGYYIRIGDFVKFAFVVTMRAITSGAYTTFTFPLPVSTPTALTDVVGGGLDQNTRTAVVIVELTNATTGTVSWYPNTNTVHAVKVQGSYTIR